MDNLIAQSRLQLIRLYFSIVGAISPRIAARKANELIAKPHSFAPNQREQSVLETATLVNYQFRGEHVQGYHWEGGAQKAVLIHGWEGHAGNFGNLIKMLVASDCSVVAFDAPGHGRSAGTQVSMFDFRAFVSGFLNQHQPDIIITHSYGSVAAITALSDNPALAVDKLVMITPPDRFEDGIHQMAERFGLSERTEQALIRQIEKESGYVVSELNVSDYVQDANVNDALVVHGQADQVVPLEWSRRIVDKWDRANLVTIADTDHYKILWRAETKQAIEEFLESTI